eukprot:10409962-Alexandrium_andersonii.AAC.1
MIIHVGCLGSSLRVHGASRWLGTRRACRPAVHAPSWPRRDGSNQLGVGAGGAPEHLVLSANRGGGIPRGGGGIPCSLAPGCEGHPDRGGGLLGRL